jgi:AraC-like DNA-binding protein
MKLLEIFSLLATSTEIEELDAQPLEDRLDQRNQQRLGLLHRLVEERYPEAATTEEAATAINLSTAAFCRYFKRTTGLTFTDFTNKYRVNQARKLLLMEKNVTEACFASGFQNLSHFNRTFKRFAGENPSSFRKKVVKPGP